MTVRAVPTLRFEAGERVETEDFLALEVPLEIRLGERPLTVLLRTPGDDEDLVRGFLRTEGIIERAEDLRSLHRPSGLEGEELGNVISADVDPARTPFVPERFFYASASCGACGKSSLSAFVVRAPAVTSELRADRGWIEGLPALLRAAQTGFAQSGGLHGAALFEPGGGRPWVVREDIGRHNTVDKAVGWAWAEGRWPLTNSVLMVSGRLGYEIVQKSIVAGIPLIVSVGAASTLAVRLAEGYGVTLAAFVRPGRMNVFGDRRRIIA